MSLGNTKETAAMFRALKTTRKILSDLGLNDPQGMQMTTWCLRGQIQDRRAQEVLFNHFKMRLANRFGLNPDSFGTSKPDSFPNGLTQAEMAATDEQTKTYDTQDLLRHGREKLISCREAISESFARVLQHADTPEHVRGQEIHLDRSVSNPARDNGLQM